VAGAERASASRARSSSTAARTSSLLAKRRTSMAPASVGHGAPTCKGVADKPRRRAGRHRRSVTPRRGVPTCRTRLVCRAGSRYRPRDMANEGNQHTADAAPAGNEPPEPSFAERARTLVHLGRTGTLSTHSRRAAGYPFGSVAPYGVDAEGRPTLLISSMAMHTQNLTADSRASLLVQQGGFADDPLAGGRVTLVGDLGKVGADELEAVRGDYLERHESARHWVDFDDFAFWRMEVRELYFVAGFGAMGWVEAGAYGAAEPDPLADFAEGILAHMNADHADALRLYCQVFADFPADEASMTSVDRMGFRVRARAGERLRGIRINFPREARTSNECRVVLVEMVRDARAKAGVLSAFAAYDDALVAARRYRNDPLIAAASLARLGGGGGVNVFGQGQGELLFEQKRMNASMQSVVEILRRLEVRYSRGAGGGIE